MSVELQIASYLFLVGLVFGSFLNVVILRIPAKLFAAHGELPESMRIIAGAGSRSQCPSCGFQLRWYHNIPVISYLVLAGKCSSCHTRISVQYPIVELSTGLVFVCVFLAYGLDIRALALVVFMLFAIPLMIIDARHYILPDKLVIGLLLSGLALSTTDGTHVDVYESLIGAAGAFAIVYALSVTYKLIRKRDGLGFGDVKLLAALGAWVGLAGALEALFLGAVIGLFMAIGAIICQLLRSREISTMIPFGPSLLLSGVLVLVSTHHDLTLFTFLDLYTQ